MTENIVTLVSSWDPFWAVFFLSMLPITELRASVPIGIAWGLSPLEVFISALLGNSAPVPLLLLLLGPVLNFLRRISFFDSLIKPILERSLRHQKTVERYGVIGLALFTGIPLPGTGVWSGSLLSYLLNLSFIKSLIALLLGVLIADILVTLASVGVFKVLEFVPWPWFLLAVGIVIFSYLIYRQKKNKKSSL